MKLLFKTIAIVLTCTTLQACSGGMNKQGAGTLVGGVAGGLLGSRFGKGGGNLAATGIGALAGALIGGQIGKGLDDNDRQILALSSQKALETAPSGSNIPWSNPDSGHNGYVTPTSTFQNDRGQYCREYTQVINVGGKEEKAYGRACRKPDGHWEIIQ